MLVPLRDLSRTLQPSLIPYVPDRDGAVAATGGAIDHPNKRRSIAAAKNVNFAALWSHARDQPRNGLLVVTRRVRDLLEPRSASASLNTQTAVVSFLVRSTCMAAMMASAGADTGASIHSR
ncbi:hypothetical protein JQ604_29180 [Bradyrhizobium jicamae]|uniref:hypothetical protein n=1 Tax=Bradyrhizobium jicamae TaxID=280332 RepID=UPI001BAC7F0A|nr:hypothetical protein [Bradyrhizobium jicamae]MBR0756269.1 hypothetical protein [Bradyrhizobium jicamae]